MRRRSIPNPSVCGFRRAWEFSRRGRVPANARSTAEWPTRPRAVVVRRQIAGIAALLDIIRDGLAMVGSERNRANRVRQDHTTFTRMAEVFDNAPPLQPGKRPQPAR